MPTLHRSPSRGVSIPEPLNRYLSSAFDGTIASTAGYVERGAALVDAVAIAALQSLRASLHAKIDGIADSGALRNRLELLAQFFEEASVDGQHGTPIHRDVTFALLYFLKGFDRVPDTIPEVGLLDDAMIVQLVFERHEVALRAHWTRRRRAWPR